jgi:hypothetical protein
MAEFQILNLNHPNEIRKLSNDSPQRCLIGSKAHAQGSGISELDMLGFWGNSYFQLKEQK